MEDRNTFFFMIPNITWGLFIAETLWDGTFNNILIVYTALILLIDYSIIKNLYFDYDKYMDEIFGTTPRKTEDFKQWTQ